MSSWQYAFMFPGNGESLRPGNAVGLFVKNGLGFDRLAYGPVAVDTSGHVAYVNQIKLRSTPVDELEARLEKGEQIQAECGNQDIFFVLTSAVQHPNPHMRVAWSRRMLEALSQGMQENYSRLVRRIAHHCGAKYLIIVNDVPDGFEDNFVELDGRPVVDRLLPSGNEYDVHEAWVRTGPRSGQPDNTACDDVEDGFTECMLE